MMARLLPGLVRGARGGGGVYKLIPPNYTRDSPIYEKEEMTTGKRFESCKSEVSPLETFLIRDTVSPSIPSPRPSDKLLEDKMLE